jgi:hypothetical protein
MKLACDVNVSPVDDTYTLSIVVTELFMIAKELL